MFKQDRFHTAPKRENLDRDKTKDEYHLEGIEKPFFQKISIKPQHRSFILWKLFPRPLILFSFPVIVYAGFSYGSNLIWFNVLNGTASSFLSAAPYNFRPSIVGLAYISPLLGVVIGSLWSGYIGDRIVLRMARRNKGISE